MQRSKGYTGCSVATAKQPLRVASLGRTKRGDRASRSEKDMERRRGKTLRASLAKQGTEGSGNGRGATEGKLSEVNSRGGWLPYASEGTKGEEAGRAAARRTPERGVSSARERRPRSVASQAGKEVTPLGVTGGYERRRRRHGRERPVSVAKQASLGKSLSGKEKGKSRSGSGLATTKSETRDGQKKETRLRRQERRGGGLQSRGGKKRRQRRWELDRQGECKGGYRRRKLDGEHSVVAKQGREPSPAKRKQRKASPEKANLTEGEHLERGRVYGQRSKEQWDQVRTKPCGSWEHTSNQQAESGVVESGMTPRRRFCVAGQGSQAKGSYAAEVNRSSVAEGTKTEETDTVREVCAVGLISKREVQENQKARAGKEASVALTDGKLSAGVRWRKGGKSCNESEVKAQEMVLGRRLGVVKPVAETEGGRVAAQAKKPLRSNPLRAEPGMEELQKRRVGSALGGMVLKRKSKRSALEARKV